MSRELQSDTVPSVSNDVTEEYSTCPVTSPLNAGPTAAESSLSEDLVTANEPGSSATENTSPRREYESTSSVPADETDTAADTLTSCNDSDTQLLTPKRPRIALADISCHTDIDRLTVRQLKALLVNHYVDYKGCCEKQELVERVQELWTDHVKNTANSDGEVNAAKEDDLCKVCMDAVVNCILLECGHMVSCTDCGKRLAECPICRRFVSRVVHVFRA